MALLLPVAAVHGHVADDQLVVVDAHATDAGADALLVGCGIVLCRLFRPAYTTLHSSVSGSTCHTLGKKPMPPPPDAAAEVQLAVVLHRIAEQRCHGR